MRVDVEAVIDLTTRAVQQMVPRGRGAILNVGSTAGFHPFPGQAGYAATKAFVKTYTEGVRAELAGTGVAVALLCPGPVRTEFLKNAGTDERKFADAFPKFTSGQGRIQPSTSARGGAAGNAPAAAAHRRGRDGPSC